MSRFRVHGVYRAWGSLPFALFYKSCSLLRMHGKGHILDADVIPGQVLSQKDAVSVATLEIIL